MKILSLNESWQLLFTLKRDFSPPIMTSSFDLCILSHCNHMNGFNYPILILVVLECILSLEDVTSINGGGLASTSIK